MLFLTWSKFEVAMQEASFAFALVSTLNSNNQDCSSWNAIYLWTIEVDEAFHTIKHKLTMTPILVIPNFSLTFELDYDASKTGIGVILSQQNKPITYYSEKLFGSCTSYNTYDVVFCIIIQAIRHWLHDLFHKEFLFYTNHATLKHSRSQDKISAGYASWTDFLQLFTFVLKRKSDIFNRVTDALSHCHSLLAALHVLIPGFSTFWSSIQSTHSFHKCSKRYKMKLVLNICCTITFFGNQLYIMGYNLLFQIVHEIHGERHMGCDHTLHLVAMSYFLADTLSRCWTLCGALPNLSNFLGAYLECWSLYAIAHSN